MFSVNNVRIFFRYGQTEVQRKTRRTTECHAIDKKSGKEIKTVVVVCSEKDNFCKNKGRILSLTKLLSELYPTDSLVHKKARTKYWEEYFKKRGKKE